MAPRSSNRSDLVSHLLVPVANEDDARATAEALQPLSPGRISVLHVVEKRKGGPDKTPIEQSEVVARDSFSAFHEYFPSAEEMIDYRSDVVAAIIEAASACEASAIAFHPRGGSRVVQFLAGDRALRLINESDRPVISLPVPDSD